MLASYFLGSRLLAQMEGPIPWTDDTYETNSVAYFCQRCGQVWGRLFQPGKHWYSYHATCLPCGIAGREPTRYNKPGSFFVPWLTKFSAFPRELLLYEASILITLRERLQ